MASSSFSPSSNQYVPPVTKDEESINWADLPQELTFSILIRIGTVDILKNAQKVCRSWRRVSKDPLMWRKIDIRSRGISEYECDSLCRQAVDRSDGGLLEIDMKDFVGNDSLLTYIADRSSYVTSLKLTVCYPITCEGFVDAVMKLKSLENLEITVSYDSYLDLDLRPIGYSCSLLKTLKLNRIGCRRTDYACDYEALGIAETMPELRRLELFGSYLTNTGLSAILENCIRLEHFYLRDCANINLVGGGS